MKFICVGMYVCRILSFDWGRNCNCDVICNMLCYFVLANSLSIAKLKVVHRYTNALPLGIDWTATPEMNNDGWYGWYFPARFIIPKVEHSSIHLHQAKLISSRAWAPCILLDMRAVSSANCSHEQGCMEVVRPQRQPCCWYFVVDTAFMRILKHTLKSSGEQESPCKTPRSTLMSGVVSELQVNCTTVSVYICRWQYLRHVLVRGTTVAPAWGDCDAPPQMCSVGRSMYSQWPLLTFCTFHDVSEELTVFSDPVSLRPESLLSLRVNVFVSLKVFKESFSQHWRV